MANDKKPTFTPIADIDIDRKLSNNLYTPTINKMIASGEIYREVNGFYVYSPKQAGFLNEHFLRAIADRLAELNEEWAAKLERYAEEDGYGCGSAGINNGGDHG